MGVSGCGKSSLAQACADLLGWTLHEGDAYHAPESIAKMRAGVPLTDADRQGWLDRLAQLLAQASAQQGVVLTCSALRYSYRQRLRAAQPGLGFAYLALDYPQALQRVQARPGHFFSPNLVADQFNTLEPPQAEPLVLTLDALQPVPVLAQAVSRWVSASSMPSDHPGAPA
ncbi:gluconokinase [Melaminivora sp.]